MSSGSVVQAHPRLMKFALLVFSLAMGALVFVALDWLASVVLHRSRPGGAAAKPVSCMELDPVRHHALRPNCSAVNGWGRDSYQLFTNSLGFRDQLIRQVPLSEVRPRIVMLGDSFTEGMIDWSKSYAGRIATRFPQYEVLNGGVESYSPSNYYNVTRKLLADGVQFDEMIVFIDISDANDEAAYYHDIDSSGAVAGPGDTHPKLSGFSSFRRDIKNRLPITNHILEMVERNLVKHGYYHLNSGEQYGDIFDMPRSAWTYRPVSETDPYPNGYAPLGLEGGIAREQAKMTLVWQELQKRQIPLSIVVYPWPAQIVHDTVNSRQVQIWSSWCQGKCKRFISAFPAFFAVKQQCSATSPGCWYPAYFVVGDVHFSAAGYALVADQVSQSLEALPVSKAPVSDAKSQKLDPANPGSKGSPMKPFQAPTPQH